MFENSPFNYFFTKISILVKCSKNLDFSLNYHKISTFAKITDKAGFGQILTKYEIYW